MNKRSLQHDATPEVIISIDRNAVTLEHHNTQYNCCIAEIGVTCTITSDKIRFDEWEDFGEVGPCYCVCLYNVKATQHGIESGTYNVEVWKNYAGTSPEERVYAGMIQLP